MATPSDHAGDDVGGWSTARYSRAPTNTAMSRRDHPFRRLARPAGHDQRVEDADRGSADKTATGGEGIEKPLQRPMIVTP